MGSDQSNMKNNITFNDDPIEETENSVLYDAEENNIKITVFEETAKNKISYFQNLTPLEFNSKNLLVYRHPTILRYIGNWKNNGNFYLATERCRVLRNILPHQNDIQICLGLKNVLTSLIFLTEQAGCRHLNVCVSSIFEANNHWKLMGFENLWKSSDVTSDLLERSKSFRSSEAIDPNELKNNGIGIEQYAFGVLCETVLRKDSEIPHVKEFIEYCKTHLKHVNPSLRPTLSAVLLHPYFNHEFVKIHSFLTELPLKPQQAKQEFFTSLNDRLRNFDENVVGTQLSELLLSRVVLLDTTAQMCLLPFLFRPQNEDNTDLEPGLFSQDAFVRFMVPKLKKVFCVRDIQIRLILLEFFPQYCMMFSKVDLTDHILPQLLLGIKDINDLLVTKTLICLAELIPILGATLVIGANRKKLFSDGRPNVDTVVFNEDQPRSITPVINSIDILSSSPPLGNISDVSINESNKIIIMETINGNENGNVTPDIEKEYGTDNELEDGDEWSWDDPNQGNAGAVIDDDDNDDNDNETKEKNGFDVENNSVEKPENLVTEIVETPKIQNINSSSSRKSTTEGSGKMKLLKKETPPSKSLEVKSQDNSSNIIFEKALETKTFQDVKKVVKPAEIDLSKRNQIPDIDELDIKNQKFSKLEEKSREFDFFKDMAPVIQKTNFVVFDEVTPGPAVTEKPTSKAISIPMSTKNSTNESIPEPTVHVNNKLFEMKLDDTEHTEQGWDDDSDW